MCAKTVRRIVGTALPILAVVAAIALTCRAAWRAYAAKREILRPELDSYHRAENECRDISDQALTAAYRLNTHLLRWVTQADTNALTELHEESRRFDDWLTHNRETASPGKLDIKHPAPITVDVRAAIDGIRHSFEAYRAAAEVAVRSRALPDYEVADREARQIVLAAGEAQKQAEAIHVFVSFSNDWRQSYWNFISIWIFLLVGLTIWLAIVTYRLVFVRLRRKLIESNATIEKQQKLAHFGELAAGLAHEIRNPLTAINARLYTLQKSLDPAAPAAEDAGVIHTEINRLDRIVKDFLRLARPGQPQFATLTARPVMEDVFQLLSPELRKQNITLILDSAVETPFRADPQQIKQVLINIVQNAADAIGQDGTITLSARFALQKLRGRSQEVVVLEVADTGPGIAPEIQAHLFDPFFSTKEDGTGLGLAISARIVEQQGGEIITHSQLGRGATFGIVLPVRADSDET
jgi:signal transduction histidine kinase